MNDSLQQIYNFFCRFFFFGFSTFIRLTAVTQISKKHKKNIIHIQFRLAMTTHHGCQRHIENEFFIVRCLQLTIISLIQQIQWSITAFSLLIARCEICNANTFIGTGRVTIHLSNQYNFLIGIRNCA